eukprot:scaffold2679_cov251-Pinguiococcus_pyrenoidosus.AAC.3
MEGCKLGRMSALPTPARTPSAAAHHRTSHPLPSASRQSAWCASDVDLRILQELQDLVVVGRHHVGAGHAHDRLPGRPRFLSNLVRGRGRAEVGLRAGREEHRHRQHEGEQGRGRSNLDHPNTERQQSRSMVAPRPSCTQDSARLLTLSVFCQEPDLQLMYASEKEQKAEKKQ